MATLNQVKRAQLGMTVKADVTGTGDWVIGEILETDPKTITITPADGSDNVSIVRGEVYKASKSEWEEFAGLGEKVGGTFHIHQRATGLNPNARSGTDAATLRPEGQRKDDEELPHFKLNEGDSDPEEAELADEQDETEEEERVRIRANLDKYIIGGDDGKSVTITGRKTVDIGDLVATHFRTKTLDEIYSLTSYYLHEMDVREIGRGGDVAPTTVKALEARYSHLNPGMQRMNLGNLVRANMLRLGIDKLPKK